MDCVVHRVTKSQEDSPGKEMATHPTTLAWKIPWMEETGRLLSMGSQRVRHVSNFTGSLVRLILRKIMLVRISFSLDKRGN